MNFHERTIRIAMVLTYRPDSSQMKKATTYRDQAWKSAGIHTSRSMDSYTTTRETAKECVESIRHTMKGMGKNHSYQYVRPSAGTGSFLEWHPSDIIAIDILPRHPKVVMGEFLTWGPPKSERPYCTVGAPPLGHYSNTSVAFVNHALSFAGFVDMIIRRHIGYRHINGIIRDTILLGEDAVRDLTGGHTPYKMERGFGVLDVHDVVYMTKSSVALAARCGACSYSKRRRPTYYNLNVGVISSKRENNLEAGWLV